MHKAYIKVLTISDVSKLRKFAFQKHRAEDLFIMADQQLIATHHASFLFEKFYYYA